MGYNVSIKSTADSDVYSNPIDNTVQISKLRISHRDRHQSGKQRLLRINLFVGDRILDHLDSGCRLVFHVFAFLYVSERFVSNVGLCRFELPGRDAPIK